MLNEGKQRKELYTIWLHLRNTLEKANFEDRTELAVSCYQSWEKEEAGAESGHEDRLPRGCSLTVRLQGAGPDFKLGLPSSNSLSKINALYLDCVDSIFVMVT